MTREALSSSGAQAVRHAVDGARPARSVLRLLGLHRRRVLLALLFFAIKDTPLWLLPVITAQVIDIVVDRRPPIELALWGGTAVVALLQNYPGHVLYTRFFMGAVRRIGADLRNAIAARLQELSIARALVRDRSILLLDEATSALDSGSEAVIAQALDRLMAGRTTLVVAHRLSTIRSADRIVVLEQGRIVEVGSHDGLLAHGGRYARLHGVHAG